MFMTLLLEPVDLPGDCMGASLSQGLGTEPLLARALARADGTSLIRGEP
jgi:hypothetical protein